MEDAIILEGYDAEELDTMLVRSYAMSIHQLVWTWRDANERRFPTPNREDAVRFAFTEALEALDASLRWRGNYSRNNERDIEVGSELADCLFMLVTTMGKDAALDSMEWMVFYGDLTLDDVTFLVADAARGVITSRRLFRVPIAISGIITYLWNHEARLPTVMVGKRLARIEARLNGQEKRKRVI